MVGFEDSADGEEAVWPDRLCALQSPGSGSAAELPDPLFEQNFLEAQCVKSVEENSGGNPEPCPLGSYVYARFQGPPGEQRLKSLGWIPLRQDPSRSEPVMSLPADPTAEDACLISCLGSQNGTEPKSDGSVLPTCRIGELAVATAGWIRKE